MIKVFVGLIALWRLVRGVELDEIKAVLSKAIDKRTSAHCGKYSTELEDSWVKTYSEFHRKELNQNYDNAKFLIFVPNLSGLADRIVGMTTAAMIAILTDRVFQVYPRQPLLPFEVAFDFPFVNISRSLVTDDEWLIAPLRHDAKIRSYNETMKDYFAVNTINDYRLQDRLLRQDLHQLMGNDVRNTMLVINRGKTIRMFENNHHQSRLLKTGLNAKTAFGCITHFLLSPKPSIFVPIITQTKLMIPTTLPETTLKIAVQIRVGDHHLNSPNGEVELDHFKAYFNCAEQIEAFAMNSSDKSNQEKYTSVIWYIATDSNTLRRKIQDKFGSPGSKRTIVTSTDAKIEHSAKESSVCNGNNCRVSEEGFQTAAAEWYLMSFARYFVISQYSGYGRSAAFMSLHADHIYTIPWNHHRNNIAVTCNKQTFTDMETISYDWSGI